LLNVGAVGRVDPDTAMFTKSAYPPVEEAEIVDAPVAPGVIVTVVGLAERTKSGVENVAA